MFIKCINVKSNIQKDNLRKYIVIKQILVSTAFKLTSISNCNSASIVEICTGNFFVDGKVFIDANGILINVLWQNDKKSAIQHYAIKI